MEKDICRLPPATEPNGQWPAHVQHVSMNLLQSPDMLAAQMTECGMKADYVFFFAYIRPEPKDGEGIWSAVDEMMKINSEKGPRKFLF